MLPPAAVLALSAVVVNNLWQDYTRSLAQAETYTRHLARVMAAQTGQGSGTR